MWDCVSVQGTAYLWEGRGGWGWGGSINAQRTETRETLTSALGSTCGRRMEDTTSPSITTTPLMLVTTMSEGRSPRTPEPTVFKIRRNAMSASDGRRV